MSATGETERRAPKAKRQLPVGLVIALLTKGAKLTKLFAIGKPVLTFGTMFVSLFAYAFWLGPWLAVLFVLLLLIHEMGHVVAMRMKGFATPTPVFIPFLGAAVFAPKFGSRADEAFIGYGGPLLGSAAALAVLGMSFLAPRDSDLAAVLLASGAAGIFLNLFNLLPVSPLDGGRVAQAVGGWVKYIGLILLAAVSVVFREPMILLIWILVLSDLRIVPARVRASLAAILTSSMATLMLLGYGEQDAWVNVIDCVLAAGFTAFMIRAALRPQEPEKDERAALPAPQRWTWLGLYLGLVAVLGVALLSTEPHMQRFAG